MMNFYATEHLMFQKQKEIENAARQAWKWTDQNRDKANRKETFKLTPPVTPVAACCAACC